MSFLGYQDQETVCLQIPQEDIVLCFKLLRKLFSFQSFAGPRWH